MKAPQTQHALEPLPSESGAVPRRRVRWTLLLLLPPYIALCFPMMYNRVTPQLFGFPFFYWYQLMWVIATSLLLGLFYRFGRRAGH